MAFKSISLCILLTFLQCYLISAQEKPCAGHDVRVTQFKNCQEPKNQNIKIHNITLTLSDDCRIIPRGCFKIRKAISAAKIEYYINKPPLKKKGTEDFCKMLDSPDSQKSLESYKSIPHKCTIPAGDYCINKGSTKVEQLNAKSLNLLTGTTTGYFSVINEGSGEKGCIDFKLTVTKKG